MTIKNYIFLLLSCLIFSATYSQGYEAVQFVENKGQWDKKVNFMGQVPAGAFFLHNTGFTVVQHNSEDWAKLQEASHGHVPSEKTSIRSHAYEVEFLNTNGSSRIIADKPLATHNNYFIGDDPSKWASDCKIFTGITYAELYPGIDIRYYSHNGNIKYDLIVKPGADPSKIALRYKGVDKLDVKNKELIIKTSVGNLKELYPYTYQYAEKGKKEIVAKYVVRNNVLTFDLNEYDSKTTLVIDPTLIFSSFSGSTADNWGFTATYGPDGSFFGGGIVRSTGFPVSPGAFQTTHAGGEWDIGIIKLSPNGVSRIYATYIGGSQIEQPHSLVADAQGNLIVVGRSNSPNFPVTAGANGVIGSGGGYDIIVTKLNVTGTAIIGSKRIGGSGDDGVNINTARSAPGSLQQNYGDDGRSEVILDGTGNIYVASCTQSNGFPTVNGFQSTFGGGKQDGVILKLPPDVSTLTFSSFLGGSGDDAAYVLSLHPTNNNIYVAGGTASNNFPGIAAGTIGSSYNGGIADGYVAIISNNGSSLIRSTYLGTSATDQVFGVQFDRVGFPYVMGQTTGSWPVQNAAWSQPGGKQFIAKLQPDLSAYVYSTVFGTGSANPNISPVAFLVDRCENVYVSGWGGEIPNTSYMNAGVAGLPVTSDAIKATADVVNGIGQDFYFFVLRKDATTQLYGSFFGQNGGLVDHVDGGTSRFDENGVIYQAICANCGAGNYPTTPGAWATTNPSTSCNLGMVKISFNFSGVNSGVRSSINGVVRDTAGCLPLTVDFRDTVMNAVSYEWNFGDGSPQVTTSTANISHTYNVVGTFNVMLVAIDSTTCNIRDTSYMQIKVGDLRALVNFNPVKLNPCDSFKYRFDNISVAPPSRPFTNTSFEWDFGDGSPRVTAGINSVFHNYSAPGTYNVKLFLKDNAYCNDPDSTVIQIRVSALVVADFEVPSTGCVPFSVQFNNTSSGGQQFTWNFGDGNTSTATSPTHTYTSSGTYTITLTAVDSATCNITDTKTITITVYDVPTAEFSVSPQPPLVNTPISFTNLSSPDAVRFKWFFGDGDSLVTTSRENILHEYIATGVFDACLIAYNAIGCSDTVCYEVRTIIEPALDVPNAFTPLTGGVNSVIMVRGYGIAKMRFIIWNRWGQKVFESTNRKIGWDGRLKGVMQPMDVYAYTLEVEFSDGTKANKKGDITLIR